VVSENGDPLGEQFREQLRAVAFPMPLAALGR